MLGIARGMAKWLAGEQTVNAPATWINELLVTFRPFQRLQRGPLGEARCRRIELDDIAL